MIGSKLRIVLLGLAGIAAAAGLGYSAHVVAGSQIGLPAGGLSGVNELAPADTNESRAGDSAATIGQNDRSGSDDRAATTTETGPSGSGDERGGSDDDRGGSGSGSGGSDDRGSDDRTSTDSGSSGSGRSGDD